MARKTSGGALPRFVQIFFRRPVGAHLLLFGVAGLRTAQAHPEIEDALARLNPLIAAAPANAALYLERGALYLEHADFAAAEANFLRAAELRPELPELARARGELALASGDPRAALAQLDRALEQMPADSAARVLRSRAHARLGQRAAAIRDLDFALVALANPPPELWLERATLCASEADAMHILDAAIKRVGPAPALQRRALALEEALGRTDAALARLDAIAAQAENKSPWLKLRGDLLQRAGRHADARAAYHAALDALAALPDWLRAAPENAALARELAQLGAHS